MTNSRDDGDWSNDSASLFREARRAHDPTPAESARLAAVRARIQAGKAEASFDADRGADIVARGATSGMLRLVASVSLGAVCIAAAYIAFIRVNRHPSEPALIAKPAPTAVASVPPPPVLPAPVPSGELSAAPPAPAVRDEIQSRPRSELRRRRAAAERQRAPRIEAASAPEASGSAPDDDSTSMTVPENDAMEREHPALRSPAKTVAVIPDAPPRRTAIESDPREAGTAAEREADPARPEGALTELAMMKRIQGALRDADFSTVLALCAEHSRRWPHGMFALEREGVRAIASCSENSDDAALRAKRFLTAHPHAPVAMRVSTACAAQLTKR